MALPYPSDLYREALGSWAMNSTSARISAGRGSATRTECVWLNQACMDSLAGIGLDLKEAAHD